MGNGRLMALEAHSNGKEREPVFSALYHDQILTPSKLFEFIQSNLHGANSKFFTGDDWLVEEEFLRDRFLEVKTIAGTQKLHSFVPTNRSTMEGRSYICGNESRSVIIEKNSNVKELDLSAIRGYVAVEYDGVWWMLKESKFWSTFYIRMVPVIHLSIQGNKIYF